MDHLAVGLQVGSYIIGQQIAQGGMGAIYEAFKPGVKGAAALKVMLADRNPEPNQRERFEREIMTLQQLDHPNIISIYEFGEDKGMLYFSMRLVRGSSVGQLLNRQAFSAQTTWPILRAVTEALDYAHKRKVIHRDIKPSNILVEAAGEAAAALPSNRVYLVDFGLSKVLGMKSLTSMGIVVGTPQYMAPEQILDQPITPRTDVYALTVVLYEMLSGWLPFDADSPEEIAFKHVEEQPPSPRKLNAEFPLPLEEMLMRGLAKNPEERFATPGQLAVAYVTAMRAIGTDACRQEYWIRPA